MKTFFNMLSPSLKAEVTKCIFSKVITKNNIFAKSETIIDMILSKINLLMLQPEDLVISQGDHAHSFYFIAKGECNVTVKN